MNEGMNELMMVSFDQYLFWCALALRKCSPPAFLCDFDFRGHSYTFLGNIRRDKEPLIIRSCSLLVAMRPRE